MSNSSKKNISAEVKSGEEVYRKINTVCLIAVAAVCITAALNYTKAIMIPLVISVFIYTMMTPIIRYMRFKLRLYKWFSVLTASILVIVPLALLIIFLINSVANFVQIANTYQEKLLEAFNKTVVFFKGYHLPLPDETFDIQSIAALISNQQVANILKSFGGVTLKIFSYSSLVFIFVFFFLIGSGRGNTTNPTIKEIQNKMSAYLYIHITASLFTGLAVWIVYLSVGIELAATFAILTILLNFIPNIGSLIAVLLPLPIVIIQFGFGAQFWVLLIIPSLVQFAIGSILEPKFLGSGLDLHPVAIIGSLVFWSLVWGIPGAFLAVPITSSIRLILSKLEPTRPFAEILSGRLPK
ncbi:MAG: AI-2E family transporter [Elusimicrobiota bacterium]|jgi:AI-2 transport protein TqsA|nr:AI-2E family transporter [Elusimicrobiota bacterium]